MLSNHLILCRPLLLLPSIFPSIRVFSNESALCIRWPKYGVSASKSVLPVYSKYRNIHWSKVCKNSKSLAHPSQFCVAEALIWVHATRKTGAPYIHSFQCGAWPGRVRMLVFLISLTSCCTNSIPVWPKELASSSPHQVPTCRVEAVPQVQQAKDTGLNYPSLLTGWMFWAWRGKWRRSEVATTAQYQRRQWHPTPVLLPRKSHGQRSLVGCGPWGRWGSDTTELLHFHFSLSCIGEGNGNPLQCSCLENPRDGGVWWAAIYGIAQSRTRLKWLSSSSHSVSIL